jgi:hypothetical protein
LYTSDNKIVGDITLALGAEAEDNDYGELAICGEKDGYGGYSYILDEAKKSELSFDEIKKLHNDDLVRICNSLGGDVITNSKGAEVTVLDDKSDLRIRTAGTGAIARWIPVPRKCLYYKASLKCDFSSKREELSKLLEAKKKELDVEGPNHLCWESGCNQEYSELKNLEQVLAH